MPKTVSFFYKNHRGEVAERTVEIDSLEWINNPGYDYQPGWFLSGLDVDRNARRSFALTHIILAESENDRKFFQLVKFDD